VLFGDDIVLRYDVVLVLAEQAYPKLFVVVFVVVVQGD
jgi:hypothetical protein